HTARRAVALAVFPVRRTSYRVPASSEDQEFVRIPSRTRANRNESGRRSASSLQAPTSLHELRGWGGATNAASITARAAMRFRSYRFPLRYEIVKKPVFRVVSPLL